MVERVYMCGLAALVVFIVNDVDCSASRTLHKCCLEDELIITSMDGVECSKILESHDINTTDIWWWLPQSPIQNELINSPNVVLYGSQPKCDIESKEFLHYQDIGDVKEFSFHVRDSEFRLDVLKEASFHDPERGRDDSFPPTTFCVDGGILHTHVVIVCPCNVITCVRMCCFDGQFFDNRVQRCVNLGNESSLNDKDFFDWVPKVDKYEDYYRLEGRFPKCDKFTHHAITTNSIDSQLLLGEDGSLKALDTEEIFNKDEYCGTHNEENNEMVIICLTTNPHSAMKQVAYGTMFIIGAICLLATVLVTIILPEMRRNIQGKTVLAHNVMLFIAYLVSSISHLHGPYMSQSSCAALTLIIQYSILAAFFWLNIMCIDIARCCRSTGSAEQDNRKFIFYSLYAWGTTSVISAVTVIFEYYPAITVLKPTFGTRKCFFNNKGAELLFFYGPMALLLATNLVLFIFTVTKISADKQRDGCSNRRESQTLKRNKYKLVLFVKLFCVMGVTWVTEVISWAVGGPTYFWYFTDFINLLRAVFIFFFICCKWSIYMKLRCKLMKLFGKGLSSPNSRFHSSSTSTRHTATVTPEPERNLVFNSLPREQEVTTNRNGRVEEFEMM